MAEKSAQELIREAQEQAIGALNAAYELTPEQYRRFIVPIKQNKVVRAHRDQSKRVYAPIVLPYTSVDGRVAMAVDEHRESQATLVIETSFETGPEGERLCKATVTSTMLGSRTAHAKIMYGGSGADSTNPLENAETSAIGRALGFLGYGLLGTGIASSDEITDAQSVRDGGAPPQTEAFEMPEAMRQKLTEQMLDIGWTQAQIDKRLPTINSLSAAQNFMATVKEKWDAKAAEAEAVFAGQPESEPEATSPAKPKEYLYEKEGWNPIFDAMRRVGISASDFETYLLLDASKAGSKAKSIDALDDSAIFQCKKLTESDEKAKGFAEVVRKALAKAKQGAAQ